MSGAEETTPRRRFRLVMLLPLLFFAGLAAIFLARLESNVAPDAIPSVLIGKPAPQFSLPALDGVGVPGLSRADLDGHVTLVNIFASWCVPCRQEHAVLERVAKDDRIRVVGINYKDKPDNARTFLRRWAILMRRSALTNRAAPLSTGVPTACRRPIWSTPTA